MERFRDLVAELNRQLAAGAEPGALRQTIALLSLELEKETGQLSRILGTAKVAVVLPVAPIQIDSGWLLGQYLPAIPSDISAPPKNADKQKAKSAPLVLFDEEFVIESVSQKPTDTLNPAFDVMEEVPTLYMHRGGELNDQLQPEALSLNDQLNAAATERQELLQEGPIKELRKAIGVNDRFQFIRELFRGDEAMYERSIKTINQFQILPEAEFWVSRELKTKLGWPIDHPLVLLFDQLIRRRFA